MDQDPTEQNGATTTGNTENNTNTTEVTNTALNAAPNVVSDIVPEATQVDTAQQATQAPEFPESTQNQTQEVAQVQTEEQESQPLEPAPAPNAALLAALDEEPAPSPIQPLMTNNIKPKKLRAIRKATTQPAQVSAEGSNTSPQPTKDSTSESDVSDKTEPAKATKPKSAKTSKTSKVAKKPAKKPKSKVGLIIAIVVVSLLMFSIIGAVIWYFAYYNNPEVVALDAIKHVLISENVSTHGQVELKFDNEDFDSSIDGLTLDFDLATNSIPNSVNTTLIVDRKDDSDLTISLGLVQMEDGIVYLRVNGIMNAIDDTNLDSELKREISTALELAEEIDDEWWEISVDDVMTVMEASRENRDFADNVYTCAIDTLRSDWSGEMAKIYQNHRFVNIEKNKQVDTDGHWFVYEPSFGNSLYKASIDKRELANFLNELPETDIAEEYVDCYNSALKDYAKKVGYSSRHYYEAYRIDTDDLEELSSYDIEIPSDMNFYFEVSNLGHRLNRFLMAYENEDWGRISANLAFDYRKAVVSRPDNYSLGADLAEDDRLEDAYYELFYSSAFYGGRSSNSSRLSDQHEYYFNL